MRNDQRAAELIAEIYDAIVSPDGWQRALNSYARAVGSDSALIWAESPVHTQQDIAVLHIAPHRLARYWTYFATRNPMDKVFANAAEGELRSAGAFAFSRQFRRSEWFNEWAKPEGFGDVMGADLIRQPDFNCRIRIRREDGRGKFAASEIALGRTVGPHLSAALKAWRKLDAERTANRLISATLDRLSLGVIIVDAEGRPLRFNHAAEVELQLGKSLRNSHGCISTVEQHRASSLQEAIRIAAGGSGSPRLVTVTLAEPGACLVIEVVPLTFQMNWGDYGKTKGVAALFVSRHCTEASARTERFVSAYGLTQAEARVLSRIVEGGGVGHVADQLGIAISTVRTHLQNLFAKTNTSRQAELARLFFDIGRSVVATDLSLPSRKIGER